MLDDIFIKGAVACTARGRVLVRATTAGHQHAMKIPVTFPAALRKAAGWT